MKSGKRVGRGGKRGTYSGRGMKGQSSRAGRKYTPAIREFIKKYPKLKGYRARRMIDLSASVSLDILEKNFEPSSVINPQVLIDRHLVRRIKGRNPQIKILGGGELTKKLIVENCRVSKSAREKIEKAKGEIK